MCRTFFSMYCMKYLSLVIMLKSDVERRRSVLGRKLKAIREAYGIKIAHLLKASELQPETIYRIEGGSKDYTVDSQITYMIALTVLIAKAKKDKPQLFTGAHFEHLTEFINQHQYISV